MLSLITPHLPCRQSWLITLVVMDLLVGVALYAQAGNGACQRDLCFVIFPKALLLQQCLPGGIGCALGAVGIDLFGALGAVHQHQHLVVFNFHHTAGNSRPLLLPAGQAIQHFAGHNGADGVGMVGPYAVLPVGGWHHQRFALAFVKAFIRRQNMHLKAAHTLPSLIAAAFCRASSMVPTL